MCDEDDRFPVVETGLQEIASSRQIAGLPLELAVLVEELSQFLRISPNVTDDFGERDRFERSVLSCAGWIVGSGCLKVAERLRG